MERDSIFKAIADAQRRKILQLLRKHERLSAGEIADQFAISKPAISEHLKILRQAGLIYAEKSGLFIYYRLNSSIFEEVMSFMLELFSPKQKEEL